MDETPSIRECLRQPHGLRVAAQCIGSLKLSDAMCDV
jgi:hypothetical protein